MYLYIRGLISYLDPNKKSGIMLTNYLVLFKLIDYFNGKESLKHWNKNNKLMIM